jgi:hypothetical protein
VPAAVRAQTRTSFPPVIAHEYIGEKLDAIGVT